MGTILNAKTLERTSAAELPHARTASWLLSEYAETTWTVRDTYASATAIINFDYMLADGRSLLEVPSLCSTVREYAFYMRDSRFSLVDMAEAHATSVRTFMHLTHALTMRGIWSFSDLQPYDLDQLVEECRFGMDGVLHASERVKKYIETFEVLSGYNDALQSISWRQGVAEHPGSHRTKPSFIARVLAACHLPSTSWRTPTVAHLVAHAANSSASAKEHVEIAQRNLTVQGLYIWIIPLERLYAMRRRIEADAINFKPFPYGAGKVAAVKGIECERTPIPPPKLALHLFEQAARLIFDHQSGTPKVLNRKTTLQLATACWIVIAGFTARRAGEIEDLRVGCLGGDADTGYRLHVYIEKTLQRKEWIPVPSLVAHAVAALEEISASARQMTGTDRLFLWCDDRGRPCSPDIARNLDTFAAETNTPLHAPRGQTPVEWHWHPHQFRRFFAVLYFYRFEGATLEALSYFLRHFNLEMTKRYVTKDPEVAALWLDVEWGYMGHVARSIAAGERAVSGGAGERLKTLAAQYIDRFRRMVRVVSAERIGAHLTHVMQHKGIVLTPTPWVTCSCPRTASAARKAACRQGQPQEAVVLGPDFANAGPLVCSSCTHAITEGSRVSYVDQQLQNLECTSGSAQYQNTFFGELAASKVVILRQFRDQQYIGATPLPHWLPDETELA